MACHPSAARDEFELPELVTQPGIGQSFDFGNCREVIGIRDPIKEADRRKPAWHDSPRGPPVNLRNRRLLGLRSEEHTSELQSLMRSSYAVFCLKKKNKKESNT